MSVEVATQMPMAIARAPVLTIQVLQIAEGVYFVHDVSAQEEPFMPQQVPMPENGTNTTAMTTTNGSNGFTGFDEAMPVSKLAVTKGGKP
ncbi:hypothetical protein LTR66_017547, partial [Elasticomyces elasticus]